MDCFHALAHAGQVLDALIGKTHPDYKKQLRRWARRRLKDKVQALIKETRQPGTGKPPAAVVEQTLGCFVRNVSRMLLEFFARTLLLLRAKNQRLLNS